jgi:hypothetical protein
VVKELKWVTREHPHVDRIACPWLISKFIDKDAEFVFIPWPGPKPTPEMGTPFDFYGGTNYELEHHDGKCTFEVIIDKYKIKDPWVIEMAKIIHTADLNPETDKDPRGVGLEAISAGAMYIVKDDYEALEKGFYIYDALYVSVQLGKLQEDHRDELSKIERSKRFDFIKSHIKKAPDAKVKRPKK